MLALVTGAPNARRAAEVAIELAHSSRDELAILFVSSPEAATPRSRRRRGLDIRNEEAALDEVVEIASRRNQPIQIRTRPASSWREALLSAAESDGATLIILGVSIRPSDVMLFGETANQLLETSPRSLLFVAT
jgi:K+:H+ antiporter